MPEVIDKEIILNDAEILKIEERLDKYLSIGKDVALFKRLLIVESKISLLYQHLNLVEPE